MDLYLSLLDKDTYEQHYDSLFLQNRTVDINTLGYFPYAVFIEALIEKRHIITNYIAEQRNFDINTRDHYNGNTILHHICGYEIKILEYLKKIPKLDVNIVNNNGYTPFMIALKNGNIKSAKYISTMEGFNYNINIYNEKLDLNFIVQNNRNIEIVKYLKQLKNLDVNKFDNNGTTAFMYAIKRNNLELAQYITTMEGFDFDININNEILDLNFIIQNNGNIETVKYLEQLKDLNVNNLQYGNTAFITALRHHKFELAQYISAMKDFDPNVINTIGKSQIIVCCQDAYVLGVKLLLSHKNFNTLNIKDRKGKLPIDYALENFNHHLSTEPIFVYEFHYSEKIEILKELLKRSDIVIPDNIENMNKPTKFDKKMKCIIAEYKKDPITTRHRLKLEEALDIYRLIVFTTDGYLDVKQENNKLTQFLNIAIKLPNDLQMTLINRLANSSKDIINSKIFSYEIDSFIDKYIHMKQDKTLLVKSNNFDDEIKFHIISINHMESFNEIYLKKFLFKEVINLKEIEMEIRKRLNTIKQKDKMYLYRKQSHTKFMIKNVNMKNSGYKKGNR